MGKAGRTACIFTPMLLTLASFICLLLIEIAGWNNGLLEDFYFVRVNLTDLTLSPAISSSSSASNIAALSIALEEAKSTLDPVYDIHLWNYCTSSSPTGHPIDFCSPRKAEFVFNPITIWGLSATSSLSNLTSSNPALASETAALEAQLSTYETQLLGSSGAEALKVYTRASKAIFILYALSFWTTLFTLLTGLLAIFSRWGSFLTWIFSVLSSLFTFGAVLTSTIVFATFTKSLSELLQPYNVSLHLGVSALKVNWLAVLFSLAATAFWLLSVCCCSGRSNPHHKSNKGGLWNAEEKGQGYDLGGTTGEGGLRGGKTGGYERVASPSYMGHASGDSVPLTAYPQPPAGRSGGYEPFRHG